MVVLTAVISVANPNIVGLLYLRVFLVEVVVVLVLAPLFQLVLMIHSLKVQHVPLIYSRQVNFVMFSFKTAV